MEELLEIIAELRETVKRLEKRVAFLEEENAQLKAENAVLRKENGELRQEIERLKSPKNSRNSSITPSQDLNRPSPNQSLRQAGKRSSGGQIGHKGNTLEMSQRPDQIVELKVETCAHCQKSLLGAPHQFVGSRQVVDIPPIEPVYIQYDQYRVCCPHCTHGQVASFPAHVKAPIQYGPGVKATVAYLSTRQYLSMRRISELLTNFFSLPVSEGTVANHLREMALHSGVAYISILQAINGSTTYVGADESGCRIAGQRGWMWTLENERHTFLWPSQCRSFANLSGKLPLNRTPAFTLLHDCYSAYFKLEDVHHQICLAHIRRDIQYIKELEPDNPWAYRLDALLLEAIELKNTLMREHPNPQQWEKDMDPGWKIERKNLENKIMSWVASTKHQLGKEAQKLQKRLIRCREFLTRFLHHYGLPPDNNGSERAIRNVKVKTKVSGQFRTMEGAEIFAILRTVIDSAIKQQRDPFQALCQLAKGGE
jgi:transposase